MCNWWVTTHFWGHRAVWLGRSFIATFVCLFFFFTLKPFENVFVHRENVYFEEHRNYFNGNNNLFFDDHILEGFEPMTLQLLDNLLYFLIHSCSIAQNNDSLHLKQTIFVTHFGINQWFSTRLDLLCDLMMTNISGLYDGAQHHLSIWLQFTDNFNDFFTRRDSKRVGVLDFCLIGISKVNFREGGDALGTPDTRRSGRSTRNALRALTSRPPGLPAAWWASPGLWSVMASAITLNNLDNTHTHTESQVCFPFS